MLVRQGLGKENPQKFGKPPLKGEIDRWCLQLCFGSPIRGSARCFLPISKVVCEIKKALLPKDNETWKYRAKCEPHGQVNPVPGQQSLICSYCESKVCCYHSGLFFVM